MHIILVYDIREERVNKVRCFCKRYLPRVQNSVFEGDLSEAKLAALKAGLLKCINPHEDSVLIWVLREARWADRQTLGTEKLPISNFL